jgi:hypothetical protein
MSPSKKAFGHWNELIFYIYFKEVFIPLKTFTTVFFCPMLTRNRHDQNPRFSISLSHLKIYYSRLTPIISHFLIINTMLQTH